MHDTAYIVLSKTNQSKKPSKVQIGKVMMHI